MIKGQYVATVTIDFHFPDDLLKKFPLDEMKKRLIRNADNTLCRIIENECGSDHETIYVEQQYADLYRAPDDEMEDE